MRLLNGLFICSQVLDLAQLALQLEAARSDAMRLTMQLLSSPQGTLTVTHASTTQTHTVTTLARSPTMGAAPASYQQITASAGSGFITTGSSAFTAPNAGAVVTTSPAVQTTPQTPLLHKSLSGNHQNDSTGNLFTRAARSNSASPEPWSKPGTPDEKVMCFYYCTVRCFCSVISFMLVFDCLIHVQQRTLELHQRSPSHETALAEAAARDVLTR